MNAVEAALVCKALGDPNRLAIVQMLSGGEKCACKLLEQFAITQPTLSHHMKILCACDLVEVRREGKWCHYSLRCDTFFAFQRFIGSLSCCDAAVPAADSQSSCHDRKEEPMKQKELYVLTGFLGAGKTSLLLSLLDQLPDRKIGIIQNEFGKLGIDGAILRRDGIEMTEISRGSIFCSCLKLSFVQALAEMGGRDLDTVFVESSGLADPSNIEEILGAVRTIAGDVYTLKGVICLVDGVNFLEQLSDVATVDRQLAHCHLAVINKVDLIDQAQLDKVIAAVRQVNPRCEIETCVNGRVDPAFLGRDLLRCQWAQCEESLNTVDNKPKTISLEFTGTLKREELLDFLRAVLPDCYRIKGFFHLEDGWQQVDVVEKQIDFKPCPEYPASELVFLSKIGPKVIRTVDNAWRERITQPMKLKN